MTADRCRISDASLTGVGAGAGADGTWSVGARMKRCGTGCESSAPGPMRPGLRRDRHGFSLLELLVVLGVTVALTSILFPAFRGVRQSALRIGCASNQRQIGTAIVLFAADHADRLPPSRFASPGPFLRPQEMMAATVSMPGSTQSPFDPDWEGLGWLVASPNGAYLDSCSCLYCPSHHGDHPFERYDANFKSVSPGLSERIYTNYHYRGDRLFGTDTLTRFRNAHEEILVSDGLRTQRDFNHTVGGNLLHGDGAVTWFDDSRQEVYDQLPSGEIPPWSQVNHYGDLWDHLVQVGTEAAK